MIESVIERRRESPPACTRRHWLLRFAAAGVLLSGPAPGRAHLVYQSEGLRELSARCDLALVVRFETPARRWRAEDGTRSEEYFRVEVLETLRGDAVPPRLDFFSHAEGLPRFAPGDRAVLFLEATAHHAGAAGLAARFPFYSVQGAGNEWKLGSDGTELKAIVRDHLALHGARPEDVLPRFRSLLLRKLRSTDPRLRSDAMAELMRIPGASALFGSEEQRAPFRELLSARKLPVAEGIVLAGLLEQQAGFDAAPYLRSLATEPLSERERSALARVAGRSRDPQLARWLVRELDDASAARRRAAATALGQPGQAAAVPALARAIGDADAGVARAALRALGRIGTQDARQVLQEFALGAVEPLRRLALAELAVLPRMKRQPATP